MGSVWVNVWLVCMGTIGSGLVGGDGDQPFRELGWGVYYKAGKF